MPLSLLSTDGQPVKAQPSRDHRDGRFISGNSAYKSRQVRIMDFIERLRAAYDISNPADYAIASIAALNLADAETSRARVHRVRATNAASRLLKSLKRKPEKPLALMKSWSAADVAPQAQRLRGRA